MVTVPHKMVGSERRSDCRGFTTNTFVVLCLCAGVGLVLCVPVHTHTHTVCVFVQCCFNHEF